MSLEDIETRIRVTKEAFSRFEASFSAHLAEKRPPNVPEWAWEAERNGIASILLDLRDELAKLEQEKWNVGLSLLDSAGKPHADPQGRNGEP